MKLLSTLICPQNSILEQFVSAELSDADASVIDSPTGDLIESFAELHLSDPSLDEASGAFGSLSKPFNGWSRQTVTPRWLPFQKDYCAAL